MPRRSDPRAPHAVGHAADALKLRVNCDSGPFAMGEAKTASPTATELSHCTLTVASAPESALHSPNVNDVLVTADAGPTTALKAATQLPALSVIAMDRPVWLHTVEFSALHQLIYTWTGTRPLGVANFAA